MRLRNALALGVTAATTGTAVLALAVAPSAAEPGSGSGATSGPSTAPSSGPTLAPSSGPSTGPGRGSGVDPDADSRVDSRVDSGSERRGKPPTCGKATDPDFPLDTRIHGGPNTYVPGGDFRTFDLDLTNTTAGPCHGVHPVLVLTDRERALRPDQIRLDFYDSEAKRWRPVAFEETEEDENIGVFTGFPGFAVPAGRTVTVGVRLAFRAGTGPNEVVANAAIVQRRGDDGDWVGESGDHRLTIAPEGTETGGDTEDIEDTDSGTDTFPDTFPDPDTSPSPVPPKGETGRPPVPGRPELALTGPGSTAVLTPASGALLLAGAALIVLARRRRRQD
ncbi:LPXTG cell wall anchor domain-containing protein [Streptomyces sp. NPDC002992]|uniref:LPXTG cell wall anchor domain-containing protein n=1 Tax=Streptomyces sp. NPDC002992 TaxID=3154273 RepID=UPI0033B84CF7